MLVLKPPQSGSLAGVTASHNRFGQYERSRRTPVQPTDSLRQSTSKANFSAASSAFASLTALQIEAWNSYADGHPVTNALGSSVTLTGHMMFVSIASQLLNVGSALPTDPPADSSVFAVTGIVITLDDTPTVNPAFAAVPTGGHLLVAASRPVSPAVSFQKTFRQFAVAAATDTDADITGPYGAAFGTLVIGQKVFFKLTPVNPEGVTGTPVIIPALVVAG